MITGTSLIAKFPFMNALPLVELVQVSVQVTFVLSGNVCVKL